MKLDPEVLRYMTKEEFRILTAVEMGHKNHEFVPLPLVESIAALKRHSIRDVISTLCKNKLLYRSNQKYEGFKLTYLGYDYLALHAFVKRGAITGVGGRMGVGKESDIHLCRDEEGRVFVLKLHRLGRISFRSIKRNRDYLQHRQHASWLYLARLAALKEFSYLKALHAHKFPVPEPVDVNRHAVLMEHIDAIPFREVRELAHPLVVLEKLMRLIVRLAKAGLIHGDFNEFNLLIDDDEHVTVIDLPQVVSIHHPNARLYFERDVDCVKRLFERKFSIEVTCAPSFDDVLHDIAQTAKASQLAGEEPDAGEVTLGEVLKKEDLRALDDALDVLRQQRDEEENGDEDEDEEDGDEEDDGDEDEEDGDWNSGASGESANSCERDRSACRKADREARDSGDASGQEERDVSSESETDGKTRRQRSNQRDRRRPGGPASGSSSGGSEAESSETDQTEATDERSSEDEQEPQQIPCYRPKLRRHDPATVRKRVQQGGKKKARQMRNAGRNKNPERMKAKMEAKSYY
ncbi:putative RIO1 family domain-containing protein [Neospora caninum Liverpool]|uniref:Serine/threonine-protein kinase RIO2 n=3 Tax=Sarcocystidae TaxID=5809 RepID=F0VLM9_NEOCL|nr:putative RIO1 family domain-containing protein [Neospora caninum Liverpool]CBZ54157.1 putative RIO1 family domain-containing protein [Neospora caninum Liverpool]CEL68857.1 TPA: RIO1 family domain-containing protein, putative [Neospora caninum Liverpool]|eukprot:XP_003884188.1 putative RIO1 family domain-containing protein [Neospora caninum Liverpool]